MLLSDLKAQRDQAHKEHLQAIRNSFLKRRGGSKASKPTEELSGKPIWLCLFSMLSVVKFTSVQSSRISMSNKHMVVLIRVHFINEHCSYMYFRNPLICTFLDYRLAE